MLYTIPNLRSLGTFITRGLTPQIGADSLATIKFLNTFLFILLFLLLSRQFWTGKHNNTTGYVVSRGLYNGVSGHLNSNFCKKRKVMRSVQKKDMTRLHHVFSVYGRYRRTDCSFIVPPRASFGSRKKR